MLAITSNKPDKILSKLVFFESLNEKIATSNLQSFFERKFIFGIRWKLILTYLLISIGPLILCTVIISNTLDKSFSEKSSSDYLRKATVFASEINGDYFFKETEQATVNQGLDTEIRTETLTNQENVYRVFIFNTSCNILYDSNSTATGKTYVVPEVLSALLNKPTWEIYDDSQTIYATATIMNNEKVNGAILIVASVSDNFTMLNGITRNLMLIIGVVGAFVSVLVYFNARIMISPLKNFLDAVERISEGRLDERIELYGHDEFTMLAEAFNDMTEQLERVGKTRD
ncbi:MAG: cell wall metabolism sensor histidine kinase WalK, partial [Clostridiales bacterium]|nr:cell wall metabolism sensor histidine kinase WalK [Clostridiales bacterium]